MPELPKTIRTLFLEELAALEKKVGKLTGELASDLEQLVLKHTYGSPNTNETAFKKEQDMRRKINALIAGYIGALSSEILETNVSVAKIRADAEYKSVAETVKGYKKLTAAQQNKVLRNLRNESKNTVADIRKILETRKPFDDGRNLEYRYRTVQKGAQRTVNNIIDNGLKRIVRGYDSHGNPIMGTLPAKEIAKQISAYVKPAPAKSIVQPREVYRERFGFEPGAQVDVRTGSVEFNSMRLARSETQRTYREVPARLAKNQKFAKGIVWVLSRSHGQTDICDDLAKNNSYGLGKGVYPVNKVPNSHPNCICTTETKLLTESQFLKLLQQGKL